MRHRPDGARALARSPAPLLAMAVIFYLSAQPDPDPGVTTLMLILRKLAHVGEYAALTGLWLWALSPVLRWPHVAVTAAAISLAYAVSDEYHQTFVEGRTGQALDVGFDALGIGVAVWLAWRLRVSRS